MTPTDQELRTRLREIELAAVDDLTITVGDDRWRAAVGRCRELRKQLKKSRKKRDPLPDWTSP